ncbi:MAG: pyridoxal-phosphate dependent enzyme [Deltaproteobacteria bacterium]|nr:pyridoxal-phosphate dependent enzyme [Deltaproteobacteria bacterium]
MPERFVGLVGGTPLALLRALNPRAEVEVYAKLEGTNLGGSVKDRAALAMITAAERDGLLGGRRLVEATSGNTGIALALIASLKGLPITLVMPKSSTPERVATMRAYGAAVELVDGGMEDAIDRARALAARGDHHLINQFANPANPQMHYETTGPEVYEATGGRVTHFVSAMGTTGTIMGTSRYLKERRPEIRVVGVQPAGESKIPGIRRWSPAYLPAIYEPHRVDEVIDVTAEEALHMARALTRAEGLFCGPSSGGAAVAALRVAASAPAGSVVVFIVCDRGDKYLSMPELFS